MIEHALTSHLFVVAVITHSISWSGVSSIIVCRPWTFWSPCSSTVCLVIERTMPETRAKIFVSLWNNNCPSIMIKLSNDLLIHVSIKALNVSLNHSHIYACNPICTAIPHGFASYTKIVIKSITIDITDPLFIIKTKISVNRTKSSDTCISRI